MVSPFGDQSPGSPLWLLTADEAEQLAGVMLQAVKETRELFRAADVSHKSPAAVDRCGAVVRQGGDVPSRPLPEHPRNALSHK